jgi:nucleotide-binding universal stress UspA family protein
MYIVKSEAIEDCIRQLETAFGEVLSKAEGKVKKEKPNLKVSTKLENGDPSEKIVETAKRGSFDIIVMGSRGLGRREYALGSVSSKVADNAPCPVLIVK